MFYKWNENTTLDFLNIYQKYPCLWNPFDVKYYDCLAKNEALKNIIKELNISELNISDCLEQIRVIREKYGQEQTRMIEVLQFKKPYESSFAWFPIIADMLAKIINDETKLQSIRRSMEKKSITICKDNIGYKSTPIFSCAHGEVKEYNLKNLQATKQDYKARPKKNTKFTKSGNPDKLMDRSQGKRDAQLEDLLHCPSCGWENVKPDKLSVTAEKTYEPIRLLENTVPCPDYTNLVDKPYGEFNLSRHRLASNLEKNNNTVPCSSFPYNSSNYTRYFSNILTTPTYLPQDIRSCTNQQPIQETIVALKAKFDTKETQLSSEQLFPERKTKQIGTSIEHCNKEIQNTICISKTHIAPPISTCAIMLQTSNSSIDVVRNCQREIQNKFLTSRKKLKQIAVNTMEQCDKAIQTIICMSVISSGCQTSERYSSTIQESEQNDTNIVECPANMQNIIGVKLNTVKCSVPNFVLVNTDRNCVPLMQVDFKLKRLESDKSQKDDTCQNQEEVEKNHALDGKKPVEKEVCIRETCFPDTLEIMKDKSAVTRALLQCLEMLMHLQKEVKTCSITSLSQKKNDMNSSEETICEPCKLANKNEVLATSSPIELEESSCLPCLEATKKDNTITALTKIFLEIIRHILTLSVKRYIENIEKGCIREEDAIDTFTVLNKIKDCADKILKIHTIADCSKNQLPKKLCPRYKSKDKCPPRRSIAVSSIQTQVSEEDVTDLSVKDLKIIYKPPISEVKEYSLLDDPTLVETTIEEQHPVKDKEITAHTKNHDISLNVSLSQMRDSETQYVPKQSQDVGVVTEHETNLQEKISIGTQKREPILVRVMKCSENRRILKSDKETCVCDAHIAWNRNVINECVETHCPVSQSLTRNTYRKYIAREHYDKEPLHPIISHTCEKEMNRIDYRTSLLLNRNYKRDNEYRNSLSYNQRWRRIDTSLELLSNRRASKIPLYTGLHKYAQKRINLHKIS